MPVIACRPNSAVFCNHFDETFKDQKESCKSNKNPAKKDLAIGLGQCFLPLEGVKAE